MARKIARQRRQRVTTLDVPVSHRQAGMKRFPMELFNRRDLYPTLLEDLEKLVEYNKKHSGARRSEVIRRLLWDQIAWLKETGWGPFAGRPADQPDR